MAKFQRLLGEGKWRINMRQAVVGGSVVRADARENFDRLVDAAERAFAEQGANASLKAIAEEAGVGIGTLYRHFPTRERLVEAVHRSAVIELCTKATVLAESSAGPVRALSSWMAEFAAFLASRNGMTEAMKQVWSADDNFRVETRSRLTESVRLLVRYGAESGVLRGNVDPDDILRIIAGIAYVTEDPIQARRLLDLVVDGLRL